LNAYGLTETTDKTLFVKDFVDDNYTLSMDEIGELMIFHSRDNGNVPHTPESTNMMLAGILKKEYAMRKVFDKNVINSHICGDIHIHNLDMPDRSYSLQFSEIVRIGNSLWPIGMLFDSQKEIEILDDMDLAYDLNGKTVEDMDGHVTIKRFLRHKTDKKMLFVYLKNGKSVICTEDHPFVVNDSLIPAKDLKIGMTIPVKNMQFEDWMFKVNNVNGVELTREFGWLIGMFITDGSYDRQNGTVFSIHQKDQDFINRVIKAMESVGMEPHDKELEFGGHQIMVYSKKWTKFLEDTLNIGKGSKRKCLPPNILQYNRAFVEGVVCGVIDGDGCVLPDEWGTTVNIGVASHALVSQLQYVFDVLGISSHCNMQFEKGKIQIVNIHGKERVMKQNMPIFRLTFRLNQSARDACKDSLKIVNKANDKISIDREIKNPGEIITIKECPSIDDYVYDFTTSSDYFLVNGIRVHNCSGHSPTYVAKYGLSLPNLNSMAKPAKYADVFLEQLIKFAASMQGHFSGAIGFDAFNVFVAPYLVGLDDKRIKQLAQIIVYEFAQQAVARGGQVVFSDLNLYWGVPKHYANVSAIGPGGLDTGIPYKEYAEESKRFMRALMQVYNEGDGAGRPFFFPKADCHITAESVDDEEYMNLLGKVASNRGSPYFIFDRGNDPSISQCCRLKLKLSKEDVANLDTPWMSRFSALQNVTMNLPGIAYGANKNEGKFLEALSQNMRIAEQAHYNKLEFFGKLMDMGREGPLALLNMDHDGVPYIRFENLKFLIGFVGLNEAVQMLSGHEMHEDKSAYMLGMKVLAHMNKECEAISKDMGFTTILEQTPAESTAYRFAKLDHKRYGDDVTKYFRGNMSSGGVYYTNSSYMNIGASLSPIERVKMEGRMHSLIDAGAMTHIWLGEHTPDPESVAQFVKKTYYNSTNSQITFSPEFSSCLNCNKTARGLLDNCPSCGSDRIRQMTRVTGYYSFTDSWNKSKVAELHDRHRVVI
jgi:ribonucleoside-triphosphate reductase (formate)